MEVIATAVLVFGVALFGVLFANNRLGSPRRIPKTSKRSVVQQDSERKSTCKEPSRKTVNTWV
jgi:hypothetical protein